MGTAAMGLQTGRVLVLCINCIQQAVQRNHWAGACSCFGLSWDCIWNTLLFCFIAYTHPAASIGTNHRISGIHRA